MLVLIDILLLFDEEPGLQAVSGKKEESIGRAGFPRADIGVLRAAGETALSRRRARPHRPGPLLHILLAHSGSVLGVHATLRVTIE